VAKLESEKYSVRAKAYDLVLNGVELGAGRSATTMPSSSSASSTCSSKARGRPSPLRVRLDAFKFGIPPHGGLSIGLDRLIAQLLGVTAMDDVIAFPKDMKGNDPMVDAPTAIDPGLSGRC